MLTSDIRICANQGINGEGHPPTILSDQIPQVCLFISRMLGALPNAFSQVATSQGYFPRWQLSICVISQAATIQVCPNCSARPLACSNLDQRSNPYPILAAAFGPYCSLRRFRRPNLTFGKLLLRKLHIWEVSTWEIVI